MKTTKVVDELYGSLPVPKGTPIVGSVEEAFRVLTKQTTKCSNCGRRIGKNERIVCMPTLDGKRQNQCWICAEGENIKKLQLDYDAETDSFLINGLRHEDSKLDMVAGKINEIINWINRQ